MASRIPSTMQRDSCQFSSTLSSAVSEWLLMFLLFLDGLFSYLVTKFACFCKLQTPCLLCSRLDHILGGEKPGFYRDLICNVHKLEISSLAYCHVHRKLADVRELCEACLLSFATKNKSNSETYRSLVRKLEMDIGNDINVHLELPETGDCDGLQNKLHGEDTVHIPLLESNHAIDPPSTRYCSCCSELFGNKPHAHGLLQINSTGREVAELSLPLSNPTGQDHLQHSDGSNKIRAKALGSPMVAHAEHRSFDRLSHIGYTELKITSDSESEVPFSDDDDGSVPVHVINDAKEEFLSRCLQPDPVTANPNLLCKTLSGDLALEKLIHTAPIIPDPSLPGPTGKHHIGEPHSIPSLTSSAAHGLEELNWNKVEGRDITPAPSEFISLQVPTEAANSKLDVKIGDVECISSTASREESKDLTSSEINFKPSEIINDPGPSMSSHMDLNDAYKLAVSNKGNQTSFKDSSRVHEDLKLLLSQISPARGLEIPWNDMTPSPSPRVHALVEDIKISDASMSTALQNLAKRLSIDRNESGFESLDGSIISEIEGESAIDRLKRQIELDRKSMSLLYKELEEERSASAIAANQAMAMITRLQEEKAAMQMEALQYQRMMEEQAEYDQEGLQKLNDLLAQREKEIQDLEAEVESYKRRFGDESLTGETPGSKADTEERENNSFGSPLVKILKSVDRYNKTDTMLLDSDEDKTGIQKDSWSDFEDEKDYISECLKRLEKKLHLFSNNGFYADMSGLDAREDALSDNITESGQYSGKEASGDKDLQQDSSLSREDTHFNAKCLPSDRGACPSIADNYNESLLLPNSDYQQQSTLVSRDADLVAIGNEVSHLNERLEALEADQNFLEHTINSLRNRNEGVRFIQEIACHLRELRSICVRRREQAVA